MKPDFQNPIRANLVLFFKFCHVEVTPTSYTASGVYLQQVNQIGSGRDRIHTIAPKKWQLKQIRGEAHAADISVNGEALG